MTTFEINFDKTEKLYNKIGPQSFGISVAEDIGKLQGISCCLPKDILKQIKEMRSDEKALFLSNYVEKHFDSYVPFPTMDVFFTGD